MLKKYLPIKFLLQQLTDNEEDLKRFHSFAPVFDASHFWEAINLGQVSSFALKEFVRSGLSVLEVLDKNPKKVIIIKEENFEELSKNGFDIEMVTEKDKFSLIIEPAGWVNKNCAIPIYETFLETDADRLKKAFLGRLDDGESIDKALEALDQKMLELIPEYQEFCKNNQD